MIQTENTFGCVGNTIRLRSGRYFNLADPKPNQFTLQDISGALSKICRFGGQIDRFYSVAEHSCLCASVAVGDGHSSEVARACLLHDAAEAFIGDCVKPLKIMLPDYSRIESAVEDAIAQHFGIVWDAETCRIVREIDHSMLIHERRKLLSRDKVKWAGEDQVRDFTFDLACLDSFEAENFFNRMAKALGVRGTVYASTSLKV